MRYHLLKILLCAYFTCPFWGHTHATLDGESLDTHLVAFHATCEQSGVSDGLGWHLHFGFGDSAIHRSARGGARYEASHAEQFRLLLVVDAPAARHCWMDIESGKLGESLLFKHQVGIGPDHPLVLQI